MIKEICDALIDRYEKFHEGDPLDIEKVIKLTEDLLKRESEGGCLSFWKSIFIEEPMVEDYCHRYYPYLENSGIAFVVTNRQAVRNVSWCKEYCNEDKSSEIVIIRSGGNSDQDIFEIVKQDFKTMDISMAKSLAITLKGDDQPIKLSELSCEILIPRCDISEEEIELIQAILLCVIPTIIKQKTPYSRVVARYNGSDEEKRMALELETQGPLF